MERTSKLADLKLVSKYYPVTNYSYPQQTERAWEQDGPCYHVGRSSFGSESSAPGLIDDRTDSEVSQDDDYQYHAHASELWDTFWKSGRGAAEEKENVTELQPRKQYPALIPSPRQRRKRALEELANASWPLPESPKARNRKPAATYSPFPKPLPLPPRSTSLAPSWQCSRAKQRPQLPSRLEEEPRTQATRSRPLPISTTCAAMPEPVARQSYQSSHAPSSAVSSQQASPIVTQFATIPSPDQHNLNFSRPVSPKDHRPTTSLDIRPSTPMESSPSIYSKVSRSATHLPLPDSRPISSKLLPKKSVPSLRPTLSEHQPQSFFEDDDSDAESESPSRSFFRFHKRSGSDGRRSSKSSESGQRGRSSVQSPSDDKRDHKHKSEPSSRVRQEGGVLGRMLGRKSR